MLVANLENVTSHYGAQAVLKGVSLEIYGGQKLGLIGQNGSGKTTILRILLGQETPTGGHVFVASGLKIGYIPQYVEYRPGETVRDFLLSDYQRVAQALKEQEAALARAPGSATSRAMRAYQSARDEYDRIEGDIFPQRAESMLDSLGIPGKGDQNIDDLSGGEKNVLTLAQALLNEPDLLVLDEPANHLDYMGVAWLEDFLKRFKGAVLIVSHNRYLLDRVVEGIFELEDGRVHRYEGGYSAYRATKLRGLLAQQREYAVNQKRLAQLEALVRRLEQIARVYASSKAGKRLRSRKSQLEREKKQAVENPTLSQSSIQANFSTEATRANIALRIREYSKSYGERTLFQAADLDIAGGERVGLVGLNGSGKTTLLRDIVQNGAWEGETIRIGPSMRVGYSAQEQEVLNDDGAVVEEIVAAAPTDRPISSNDAFALLTRFMFTREDMRKRVRNLSGGERNRLQLARLMVMKPNFLILDEPTNHLDVLAREAVEEAFENFEGTMLVVSHDRYFLDKIVNRVVEVQDHQLVSYDGNFTEFWHEKQGSMVHVAGRISTRSRSRREARAERAADRSALATLERRIQEAEGKKLSLERQLADAFTRGDSRDGRRVQRQLDRATSVLEDLYDQWVHHRDER